MSRPFAEVRSLLLERARARRNPFTHTDPAVTAAILERLTSTDDEPWVEAFLRAADGAERRGDLLAAYGYARAARYPAPLSPAKRSAYVRSQALYLAAMRTADPPLQRVRIPFAAGEIVADLRIPKVKSPVVVLWGGIDAFKEERRTEGYLRRGLATLAVDMPGTGDAPIPGGVDAERLWTPVFDWLGARPDLDGRRVAIVGGSTGGYWAAKLAHTHRERIVAAVDHGGPAHLAFARAWIERSERGEYPFALAETLAAAFGMSGREEWIERAPELSLVRQRVLERPCASLLLVDGRNDTVFPIDDLYLVLARHSSATARVFAGGHMGGEGAEVRHTIVDWVADRLAGAERGSV